MRSALTLVVILLVCVPALAQANAATTADATKRADSYVSKMSPEQRIDYIGGTGFAVRAVPESKIVSDAARQLAAKVDAVIVAAGFDNDSEGEGADRPFSLPFGQDELIREISAANKNTIVAITSGGNVDVASWIEHVPGLIEMWYPGKQGGTALAEILFGVVNPSGHLPATFEKSWQDNPTHG